MSDETLSRAREMAASLGSMGEVANAAVNLLYGSNDWREVEELPEWEAMVAAFDEYNVLLRQEVEMIPRFMQSLPSARS